MCSVVLFFGGWVVGLARVKRGKLSPMEASLLSPRRDPQ